MGDLSDVSEGVIIGVVSTLITTLTIGTASYFATMFQDEIKAWLKGYPERRREKKFNLAMMGNRRARKWCKRNLPDEWRWKKYEPLWRSRDTESIDRFTHVMWAISPDVALDAPKDKYVAQPYDPEVEQLRERIEANQRRRHESSD